MKKLIILFFLLFSLGAEAQTDTTVVGFTVSADPLFKNTIVVDVIWSAGPATSYRSIATNRVTGAYGSLKYGSVTITFSASAALIVGPKKQICF